MNKEHLLALIDKARARIEEGDVSLVALIFIPVYSEKTDDRGVIFGPTAEVIYQLERVKWHVITNAETVEMRAGMLRN